MSDELDEPKDEGSSSLPWRGALVVVGLSFLTASAISTGIAQLLFSSATTQKAGAAPSEEFNVPRSTASLSQKHLNLVLERNIFNAEDQEEEGDGETQADEEKDEEDNAVKSSLPVKLLGTIYGGDPFSGAAIIENSSKRSINTFMVGDQLLQNAKILEVLRERVIIDNAGQREYINVPKEKLIRRRRDKSKTRKPAKPGPSPIATEPPPSTFKEDGFERKNAEIAMTEAYRQKLLTSDFTKVLQDAKASPNMVDNELRGFKLTRIRKDSIYEKAGFQNNDVVEEVNGVPLNDTGQAIKLLQSLRNEKEIEVRLSRGGNTMTFTLNIR